MIQFQSLNTNDIPPTQRLSRYTQLVSETYAISNIRPLDPAGFGARLSRIEIGRVGLTWMEMTPSVVEMDGGRVGAWSSPAGGDTFLLAVQESGTCVGTFCGQEVVTRPGDMMLIDPLPLPWRVDCVGTMRTTTIKLPADRLIALVGDAHRRCGMPMDGRQPRVALGFSLIRSIRDAFQRDIEEMSRPHYEDLLFSVIATLLTGVAPNDDMPKCGSLRRLASAVVERNLSDPELDVGMIAMELGTSTRTIQRTFLEAGYTPRSYILDRRIATAAERLRHGDRRASITDIALSLGFNDLSNFTRSFTRKTGMSPRAYRIGH